MGLQGNGSDVHERILQQVQGEVVRLHDFLVGWFRGELDDESFGPKFADRFAPELRLIPPSGRVLLVSDFSEGTKDAFGSNPDFSVKIRNVEVLKRWDNLTLATYEEWQRNAKASQPPNNGRVATVLFESMPGESLPGLGEGESADEWLRWRHIHETWLPGNQIDAGPYDF